MKKSLDRGISLFKTKRYEQALAEFLSLDIDPGESEELSYYIGLCYVKLEKYEDALLYLEQVVTANKDLYHVYQCRMLLSYIYAITKRFRLAEFELKELINGGYESPQVYSAAGYVAYFLSRIDESLGYLQKALSIDPENPNALNSMGYIMADKDIDPEGALSYLRTAVKKRPDNPAYLDSLGWAYFKSGNPAEARAYLKRALSLAGSNKIIAEHLRQVIASEQDT
ncbi:MAG TPA: tetratricopeptide repeat protein [Spirochaetia bacterium]|nr:tetratricopeptide repeat protein [Spirochaetia bacterium]